jgi:hypothetical protein
MAVVFGVAIRSAGGGESAAQKRADKALSGPVYTTTPAGAAVFLAKFRPPPGFRRDLRQGVLCGNPKPEQICFARRRSVVPTDAAWTQLLNSYGLTIVPGLGPGGCRIGHYGRTRLTLAACTAATELHGVRLLFSETSLVRASAGSVVGTTAKIPLGPGGGARRVGGTQIEITDIGTFSARCTKASERGEYPAGCPHP